MAGADLRAVGLRKSYKKRLVVEDVSLRLARKEIVGSPESRGGRRAA